MKVAKLVMSAVAATVVVPLFANAQPAPKPKYDAEKCYGVNAAGKNDCAATGNHSCAGMAKRDRDPNSWIYVPTGSCQKIAGGSLTAKNG